MRKICIFFVDSTDVMENLFHMIRLILFFRVTVPPKYGSSKLIPVREKVAQVKTAEHSRTQQNEQEKNQCRQLHTTVTL